jgi:hypothetical protein
VSSPKAVFLLSHPECEEREQRSSGACQPDNPEQFLVYRIIQENLETFLCRQQEDGRHVPRFVERELCAVLECGVLACGFLRLKCESCEEEKLLPSCAQSFHDHGRRCASPPMR